MLARIYFLPGLLLVSMLFINVLNATKVKRLKEWIQEYKSAKRESETLHRFIRKRQKCEKKIDKRIDKANAVIQKKCIPESTKYSEIKKRRNLFKDTLVSVCTFSQESDLECSLARHAKHPKAQCARVHEHFGGEHNAARGHYRQTLVKDSNYYISQIYRYKKDIALCKWQLSEMDKVMNEKLRLAYRSSEPKNQVDKLVQNTVKKDKRLYYLHKQLDKKQQALFKKMNLKPFHQLLDQAQKQNRMLSAQLSNNPALSLPPQYQLKSRVQPILPQNIAGIEPNKKQELQDKFSSATNYIDALLDSMNLQINLDSMYFKKNPYREMLLKDRIEKYMNWQAQKSNNYFPAILDIYFGLGFKLSPKITPQAGILYKVGMGKDIEHIQISQQGFGLRGGANYLFYKNSMLFISYEQAWFKATQESNNAFKAIPGLVIGLGIKGKLTVQIGYDFLQVLNPKKGSPWILNFGI